MKSLRIGFVLALLCGWALACAAQDLPIKKGATELGFWGGGGTGVGHSDSVQYANAAFRFGKVLTGQHGPGFLRGNFEYALDIEPVYVVFQDALASGLMRTRRQTVYGAAVTPLVAKWNFTSGKKIVPFAALEGTTIFTTKDIPAGDTSIVNFGTSIGGGVQVLQGDRHSLTFSGHLVHISNASLGDHNPSYNLNLQFRIGYQWWK